MSAESKTDREEILAMIPSDASRVKVIDEKGQTRFRDINSIFASDEIVLQNGRPVCMMAKPGRPAKEAPPQLPEPVTPAVGQLQAAKEWHIHNDPLIAQIATDIDNDGVLHQVLTGLATEAASLAFERTEAERNGKSTSDISARRSRILLGIAETFLKRKEQLADKVIEMDSPAFTRLFTFLMDTVREAMLAGGVSRDQVEVVFQALSKRIDDETWGVEARIRMKGT